MLRPGHWLRTCEACRILTAAVRLSIGNGPPRPGAGHAVKQGSVGTPVGIRSLLPVNPHRREWRGQCCGSSANTSHGWPRSRSRTTRCATPPARTGAGRPRPWPTPRSAASRSWRSKPSGPASRSATGSRTRCSRCVIVSIVIFVVSLPIAYWCSVANVDIDLLTRGAGFGYIGSTITSLIYASFTFIFFAIETAIWAQALQLAFGLSLAVGYLLCSLVIIPLVFFGVTSINKLQAWTQPVWVVMLVAPFVYILAKDPAAADRVDRLRRARRQRQRHQPADVRRRFGRAVLARGADRRTGRLPALPARPQHSQPARMVDGDAHRRPGLDRHRGAEGHRRQPAGGAGAAHGQQRGAGGRADRTCSCTPTGRWSATRCWRSRWRRSSSPCRRSRST
jgi:hypothetical protein